MAFGRNKPTSTTPLSRATDDQVAAHLDALARNGGSDPELIREAARRLRRGGGVHISDSSAGGDIIATSHRFGH